MGEGLSYMRAQFLVECKLFTRNLKNQILFGLFLLATIYTAVIIVPQYQPIREVDRETYERQIEDAEYVFENYEAADYDRTIDLYTSLYEVNQILIEALEQGDFETFLLNEPQQYGIMLSRFDNNDPNFFEHGVSSYEQGRNQQYYSIYTQQRYNLYIESDIELNENIIEERTVLQTIQRMLEGVLPYFLIALLIFYSIDSVTKDKKHPTILHSLPSSSSKRLWAKSFAVLVGYFATILIGFILFSIIVGSRYGFGSPNIPVPIYGYDYSRGDILADTTIALFLIQALILLFFISLIYIRSIIFLSLLFRQEFLNLIVALPTMFISELWNRTGVAYVTERYSFMPPSYFNIGEALIGRLNFVYTTAFVTFGSGVVSLAACWLIIEIFLFLTTRFRYFRRV